MTTTFEKKLLTGWDEFTPSGKRIASFFLNDISAIPFETAASLSRRIGVSPMTMSRFLRQLGYAGLSELKEELRTGPGDPPWLELYRVPPGGAESLKDRLDSEIKTLVAVYRLVDTPEWQSVVTKIARADKLSIASFQQGRFIGRGFSDLLQPVKPHVRFVDGGDGAYIDTLLDSGGNSCVILIDFQRYSRHFRALAEEAASRDIPLIIITDTNCYWARDLTGDVLMMPLEFRAAWHNFGSLLSLLSLLVEAVIRDSGDIYPRIAAISELRQKFVGFVGPEPGRGNGSP